jgi:hypothetical protein
VLAVFAQLDLRIEERDQRGGDRAIKIVQVGHHRRGRGRIECVDEFERFETKGAQTLRGTENATPEDSGNRVAYPGKADDFAARRDMGPTATLKG